MAQLQIRRKFDSLGRRDISIGDEDHVRDRPAREDCPADKLTNEVNAAVLICDGHNNSNWDKEDGADTQRKKQTVPWQMHRVTMKRLVSHMQ